MEENKMQTFHSSNKLTYIYSFFVFAFNALEIWNDFKKKAQMCANKEVSLQGKEKKIEVSPLHHKQKYHPIKSGQQNYHKIQ